MSPGDLTKMSAKDMVVNIKSEPLDNSTADSAPSYDELQQLRVDHNNGLADLNTMVPSALNIGIIPDIEGICPAPGPLSAPLPRNNSVAIGDSPPLLRRYESDAMMRQRLFTTLKHTFPGSALMKALYFCSNELNTNDKLTSSCFGSLNLDKVKLEEFDSIEGDDDLEAVTAQAGNLPEGGGSAKTWIDSTSVQIDDDLTSLGWLQDHELLKNITTDELKIDISRQEHPSNIPYNPQKHIKSKPPYSFSCLIFMAIEDIANKRLPVKDIYGWMLRQFPYFRNAPTGWKNSVRHNLSLNKCFRKVDRYQKGSASGKGSLWMIDPDYRPNLLQALRKTPYHPFHQLQMMSNTNGLPPPTSTLTPKDGIKACDSINNNSITENNNNSNLSLELFPHLSNRINKAKELKANLENHADIDVANTLMEMKNTDPTKVNNKNKSNKKNRRKRSRSPPEFGSARDIGRNGISTEKKFVPTRAPSADHTYNSMQISDTSDTSDSESESCEDMLVDQDEEEEEDQVHSSATSSDEDDPLSRTRAAGDSVLTKFKAVRHSRPRERRGTAATKNAKFGDSEETAPDEDADDSDIDNKDEEEEEEEEVSVVVPEVKTTDGGRRIRRPKRFYDDVSPPPSRRSRMATKRARKTKAAAKAAGSSSNSGSSTTNKSNKMESNAIAAAAALAMVAKPLNRRRRRKQTNPKCSLAAGVQRTPEEEKRLVAEGADALLNLAGITA